MRTPSPVPVVLDSPLPAFDRSGNLPIGNLFDGTWTNSMICCGLDEMRQRFVVEIPSSTTRPQIWSGWMRHRLELEQLGIPYSTLVDGSFVTNKLNPKDIDLVILVNGADLNALTAAEQITFKGLFDRDRCQAQYLCDCFALNQYPIGHLRHGFACSQLSYWTRVFGADRYQNPKAFLIVSQRGVR